MDKLRELRKEKNVKQEDIANYLGITKQSYSRYELGIAEPNITTLKKLADYFHISVDYIIGHNFYNELGYLTEEQKNFVQTFLGLNPANQTKAVIYVAGLLLNQ